VISDIIYKKFEPKDWFSEELQDLLIKMLDHDPKKRLGAPELGGIDSIKKHPWFEEINWDKMFKKEYKPPIRPKVKNEHDTKNIDGVFLNEDIGNTP
jgi:serine/threonine protein kinase